MKQLLPRLALSLFAAMFVAVDAAPAPESGLRDEGAVARGLQAIKAELKLSPHQESLWQVAEAASATAREAMLRDHARLSALLDGAPAVAPRGATNIDAVLEATREEGRRASEVARDRWLLVYDSLDLHQQQIASAHIRGVLGRLNNEYVRFRMHGGPGGVDQVA